MHQSDWTTIKPMANEGERLVVLETEFKQYKESMKEVRDEVKILNRNMWITSGGLAVLILILKLATSH